MSAPSAGQVFFGAAIAAVALAVIGGLLLLGSPGAERQRRLDVRRVDDLRQTAAAVDLYRTQHQRLPASLDDLPRGPGPRLTLRDPTTGEPYEYRARGDSAYELCAGFERSSAEQPYARPDFWAHATGRQCFQLDARTVRR